MITSAMKDVGGAAAWAIVKACDGAWGEIADADTVLGIAEGAACLPTDTWRMEQFTLAEYEALLASVKSGTVVIDGTVLQNGAVADQTLSNTTVEYVD